MTAHRLAFLEKAIERDRAEVAATLKELVNSRIEMAGDIRMLVKEQTALTRALGKIAEFQYTVKTMHSTQQRLFGRMERIENGLAELRDEFHVYRARQDGKNSVLRWIAGHWHLVTAAVAAIGFGAWISFGGKGG